MKYDILFLGRLFPKEQEAFIKSYMKTGMQDAANALQWNIIDGLDDNRCGKINILNYLPVDSYPKGYKYFYIKKIIFHHTNKYLSYDISIGIINITIIKQFINIIPLIYNLYKWIYKNKLNSKIIIIYTMNVYFLKIAKIAKNINKNIKIFCIVADLPQYTSLANISKIHKLYNLYITKKNNDYIKYIDGFVLLTKYMANKLDIKVPYITMEGIAPASNIEVDNSLYSRYSHLKYILYSGTLNYKFGIKVLLDAFSLIKKENIYLIICGFGEAEDIIKNYQRVVFLGRVDRKQVIYLQRQATILVNPRQNNEEFTKYSFPSKTMEYLAAGVPVVAYKLDGIPDEYDEYIYYVQNNTPEALADKLSEVLEKPDGERYLMGKRAKDFVMTEKNRQKQAKKILDFIQSVQ